MRGFERQLRIERAADRGEHVDARGLRARGRADRRRVSRALGQQAALLLGHPGLGVHEARSAAAGPAPAAPVRARSPPRPALRACAAIASQRASVHVRRAPGRRCSRASGSRATLILQQLARTCRPACPARSAPTGAARSGAAAPARAARARARRPRRSAPPPRADRCRRPRGWSGPQKAARFAAMLPPGVCRCEGTEMP